MYRIVAVNMAKNGVTFVYRGQQLHKSCKVVSYLATHANFNYRSEYLVKNYDHQFTCNVEVMSEDI